MTRNAAIREIGAMTRTLTRCLLTIDAKGTDVGSLRGDLRRLGKRIDRLADALTVTTLRREYRQRLKKDGKKVR